MIELILLQSLAVGGLLYLWFETGLPLHVFRHLRFKNDPPAAENLCDYQSWLLWINVSRPVWGELLTCTGCLSTHLSWILSLFWLATGIAGVQGSLVTAAVGVAGGNLVYRILTK